MRYAEYYVKVPHFSAGSARLKDITLDKVVVTAGGKDHVIPLDPPMSSYGDARERVVAMDKTAIAALGRSSVTVKEYRAPRGFQLVVFIACATTYCLFTLKSTTQPGSLLHHYAPGFANFCAGIRPYMSLVLAIHVAEASSMIRYSSIHFAAQLDHRY